MLISERIEMKVDIWYNVTKKGNIDVLYNIKRDENNMSADFSKFKDYYFMKCFTCKEHRDDFNNGTKVYINSIKYFHDLENSFQRDFEGGVFNQSPHSEGHLIFSKSKMTSKEAVEKVKRRQFNNDDFVCTVSDCKLYINGYIYCLAIIPKSEMSFENQKIVFNKNSNIKAWFYYFLNQYANESGYAYISVYDAELFMEIFYEAMSKRGYLIYYGCVDYQDLSSQERIKYYIQHDIGKLVFSKDKKYSYQNEFRIFLQNAEQNKTEHIEEKGINMQSSVIMDMAYLSPDYVEKLKICKNKTKL